MNPDLTPAGALTLAGASLITTIIVETLIRAWQPTPQMKDRIGPALALLVGIAVVVVIGLTQHADVVQSFITGLLAGAAAMGIHDTTNAASSAVNTGG